MAEVNILLVEDDDVDVTAVQRAFKTLKIANPLLRAVDGLVPSALLTAAGNQMVLETSLPDGTPVLAASAPVPDLGWAVRVYEPTSSAYAPLNEMIARLDSRFRS